MAAYATPIMQRAASAVHAALKTGTLARPTSCEARDQSPPPGRDGRSGIQAHHDDYAAPLSVRWLCVPCHRRWHLRHGPGANSGHSPSRPTCRIPSRPRGAARRMLVESYRKSGLDMATFGRAVGFRGSALRDWMWAATPRLETRLRLHREMGIPLDGWNHETDKGAA